jgi:hypothetical protein
MTPPMAPEAPTMGIALDGFTSVCAAAAARPHSR